MSSGQPAGKFNPKTIVYSEYEVRTSIYHAMCYIEKRIKSENIHNSTIPKKIKKNRHTK